MSWEGIRGHDIIIRSFDSAWKKGRLGHAYFFVGPAGVGKHTVATELGKALLCTTHSDRLVACEVCASCKLVDAKGHPDLHYACRPEELVEFPIEVIRELMDELSLKPARGGRRIAIIDDIDDLNAASANAFLKTLEEPAPGSILFLIGGVSADRQLPTILSRCQVITFFPLRSDAMMDVLKAHGVTDPVQLDRLVRVAGGSVGDALSMDDGSLWLFRSKITAWLAAEKVDCLAMGQEWIQFVEEAGKDAGVKRRRASLVLRLFIGMLQDAQRIAQGVPPLVADRKEASSLLELAGRLGPAKLLAWIDRAIEADLQNDRKVKVELLVEAFADFLGR